MTTPSSVPTPPVAPQPPAAPVPDETVVATAKKLVRVRSFTKSAFEKVGVPVLIGGTAAVITDVVRNRRLSVDVDVDTDTVDDSTE